jgi:putative hydrolase of the HAD superfamily
MKKIYKNIYFDIDRTLWDLKTNSDKTLSELLDRYFPELNTKLDEFLSVFYTENEKFWKRYRDGEISKEYLRDNRFNHVINLMGLNKPDIAKQMGDAFVKEAPFKTALFPNTLETLEYLKNKKYRLFLLTNGFVEVQISKIRESKLEPYFEKMITSEEVGYQKPNKKIFEYALKTVNAKKSESLMIGDDLHNDIFGAKNFGMDTVFFNPAKIEHNSNPTFEINDLKELKTFL